MKVAMFETNTAEKELLRIERNMAGDRIGISICHSGTVWFDRYQAKAIAAAISSVVDQQHLDSIE